MQRILFAFGLYLLLVSACKTPAPIDWAKQCAERFVAKKDTVRITTESIKTDTIHAISVQVPHVVKIACPPSDTIRVVEKLELVDCPPSQMVVKTHYLHDSITIYTVNVAAENLLKSQLDTAKVQIQVLSRVNRSLISDISKKKQQVTRLTWVVVIDWVLIILAFLFIYKTENKLWQKL
jgi:hypothetical protein